MLLINAAMKKKQKNPEPWMCVYVGFTCAFTCAAEGSHEMEDSGTNQRPRRG